MLRTAGFDFHVLVGLQIQLEHVEHVTVVEHIAGGFAEIAERRGSHLYGESKRHVERKPRKQKKKTKQNNQGTENGNRSVDTGFLRVKLLSADRVDDKRDGDG